MKGRANSSKTFSNFLNSHFPCDKHPFSSSPVGICPHCLNDQLLKLVCSDCGERRASACSCSRTLFHRNSCSNADVGRISFLIESDKIRRSSSFRAGVKKSGGFSRIKGLFVKRRRRNDDEDGFGVKPNQMDLDRFCVFPIEERDLSETGFIELKQQLFSAGRSSRASDARNENFEILAGLRTTGNSCRLTMNERGIKQGSRSTKLWKWIFKNRDDN